ncbi:HelD family protein [Corynebacterium heidelbergense]|uniref:Helicase n=1 Tax=Corynebacterium heidelbergense TaxID=2055947 RepID=A0A364V4C9_9CORY|nr:AAA family ATPase [Corynebacterium heidelbergense]RAV31479.1 helicase [Corynebacterium heidelbergense]
MPETTPISAEQSYLDELLALVDEARARLNNRLKEVRREADIDDPQGLMMRDREAQEIALRLENFSAAEVGLMFGRIDVEDPEPENPVAGEQSGPEDGDSVALDRRYIGRIGLHDNDETMRTLLMDWRAPQARPFYLATTLHPEGVHRRRHIRTRGRAVVGVTDEALAAEGSSPSGPTDVGKEAALLEAVTRARTPVMRDIVETIAAEQDSIIRSPHRGVLVVQGAPGTGKTAVALHRAAYLLYTWREQLARTGVLIVGPNDRFLRYISQVLPSLGETGVVLATPGTLVPGIQARPEHSLLAREVKGSIEMVPILRSAARLFQRVPEQPRRFRVDGVDVDLTPQIVRSARTRARRSRRSHNAARPVFVDAAVEQLARQMADRLGEDPLGGDNLLSSTDVAQLREELREDPNIAGALEECWPLLGPEDVLTELYAHPERAAAEYDEETWEGLRRAPEVTGWTDADTPLLDELADLLGFVDDEEAAAAERAEWLETITEAQEALDILAGSASQDLDDGFAPEILMAYDVVDAEALAARQRVRDTRSTAQRARADARWAFGHVIVDEAQELSAMAWRMIFRRCPNRWMTLVGDPAQTGNPSGVEDWGEALSPAVQDRWELHELTVNYRTPEDIAQLAGRLLPLVAPDQRPAVTLRRTGTGVRYSRRNQLAAAVAAAAELAGQGLVGVLTVDREAILRELAAAGLDVDSDRLVIADVTGAKGLEFDEVVLVEPADIAAASPQGYQDLYVALTRATQGLSVVHDSPLPWPES